MEKARKSALIGLLGLIHYIYYYFYTSNKPRFVQFEDTADRQMFQNKCSWKVGTFDVGQPGTRSGSDHNFLTASSTKESEMRDETLLQLLTFHS